MKDSHTILTLTIIVQSITIAILNKRINIANDNIEALKEWIKVLHGLDLDRLTEVIRSEQRKKKEKKK